MLPPPLPFRDTLLQTLGEVTLTRGGSVTPKILTDISTTLQTLLQSNLVGGVEHQGVGVSEVGVGVSEVTLGCGCEWGDLGCGCE